MEKKLMTYKEFRDEAEYQAEKMEDYLNAQDANPDLSTAMAEAIRVDARLEDEEYVEDAYGDYLKDEAKNVSEAMETLEEMDGQDPILTISNSEGSGRIEAGSDHDKNGEPFDFWDFRDMPEEVLVKAKISSVYKSSELDRWCIDAELDSKTFIKCFKEAKEGEPSNE